MILEPNLPLQTLPGLSESECHKSPKSPKPSTSFGPSLRGKIRDPCFLAAGDQIFQVTSQAH